MNFHETYCIPGISVEEAWRVEDPISMASHATTKCSGRFKSHSRTKCGGRCPKGI